MMALHVEPRGLCNAVAPEFYYFYSVLFLRWQQQQPEWLALRPTEQADVFFF
jgi:hypothetical protein